MAVLNPVSDEEHGMIPKINVKGFYFTLPAIFQHNTWYCIKSPIGVVKSQQKLLLPMFCRSQ